MSLYHELRRRNVLRMAIAYLALAWLLSEVTGALFAAVEAPDWVFHTVVLVLVLGFVPTLVFAWACEITPEGLKRRRGVGNDVSISRRFTAKRLDVITIVLIMMALLFSVADRTWLSHRKADRQAVPAAVVTDSAPTTEIGPAESPYPANSIAVLPFVNMSDDENNEYFSDGISEELLNLLARIPELRVTSRSSAFSVKGRNIKITEIARELNVAHVLEGSVRKAGDQVRITAQLVEAHSDTHLWSETYDRTLDDIFAVQDEIAAAVVDALKLTLLGGAPQAEPVDPEAYSLFLQARHLNAQGTAQTFNQSIELHRQALAIAPDYAQAWHGLSANYGDQVNAGLLPRDEGVALARTAINQALAIDPGFAEAYGQLGWIAMAYDGDLGTAATHFEHALSLEPANLALLSYSSSLLLRLGRVDEAVAIREYDVAHDPLDPIGHNNLAWAYLLAGRPDETIAAIRTLLLLAPDFGGARNTLGKALLIKGDKEAALQAMQEEPSEAWRLFGLSMACHALGRTDESDAALVGLIDRFGRDQAYYVALVLAYRGEADRAFAWLYDAARDNATSLTYIAVEPWFANIHDDPRWLPFLERVGMSPAQLAAIEFEVKLPPKDVRVTMQATG